jgi:hypothetical protein
MPSQPEQEAEIKDCPDLVKSAFQKVCIALETLNTDDQRRRVLRAAIVILDIDVS